MLRIALLLLALAGSATTASAQNFIPYTDEDASILQLCLEASQAVREDPQATVTVLGNECVREASNVCMAKPENDNTVGISECVMREATYWEELMVAYADTARARLADNEVAKFDAAQAAWVAYRSAQCDFQYEQWIDGTIRTIVYANCILDESAARLGYLYDLAYSDQV